MAFRITYQGALIETDTAGEVQQLLLAFAQALPVVPLLSAPPTVDAEASAASARPREQRRIPSGRGGGRGSVSGAASQTGVSIGDRILAELRLGTPLKPGVLWGRLGVQKMLGRRAIQPLIASGVVIADGLTASRVFKIGRRSAKEGV